MDNKKQIIHIPLHKKLWYSITKFEKYPEMAAEGVGKAFGYLTWIMIIFAIIVTIGFMIKFKGINVEEIEKVLTQIEISEEDKTAVLNFLNVEMQKPGIYIIYGIALTIGTFIVYFLSTLLDALILSFFGLLTSIISGLKIRYRAIFNMSIYAYTISTILQLIYLYIKMFTEFEIKYFDIMYTTIAFIALAAAIFMIKSDVIKQQIELMKIIEIKKKEQEQNEEQEKKEEKEEQEEQEEKQEEQDEQKENEGKLNDEAQGET